LAQKLNGQEVQNLLALATSLVEGFGVVIARWRQPSRRTLTGGFVLVTVYSIESCQIMYVSDTSGALKQVRKTPWKFQQTFKTSLNNLQPFVAAIPSAAPPESACVTIEQAVFEPKHWIDLLALIVEVLQMR
jgi:hypothetical protein